MLAAILCCGSSMQALPSLSPSIFLILSILLFNVVTKSRGVTCGEKSQMFTELRSNGDVNCLYSFYSVENKKGEGVRAVTLTQHT